MSIELFSTWQVGRSFSQCTIRRRVSSLSAFSRFISPLTLGDATAADVEAWLGTLITARTKHAYRSDLSAFYSWAVRRHVCTSNPMLDVDTIRVPKGLPRPLDRDVITTLIVSAPDDELRLILALAAYGGLRRSEIAGLTTDQVHVHSTPPMMYVLGKGNKRRLVPIHPYLLDLLDRRRPSGNLVHVSADTVGKRAAGYMRLCGFDATLHQLRHTFGAELSRITKGNIPLVGGVMGHEDLNTTMNYVPWAGGEAAAVIHEMYGGAA